MSLVHERSALAAADLRAGGGSDFRRHGSFGVGEAQ
jgi:hypothetical protein